jgi:protein-S-isoprenylcysteine O-methyltransferase Ste14
MAFADWNGRPIHGIGLAGLAAGLALLCCCVWAFYREGRGTLAPWDPPRHLVTTGPYRWSRNPMYVAVLLILTGWSVTFGLTALWVYSVMVAIAFHVRVVVAEEPFLARTQGARWSEYRRTVRRWF